MNRPCPIHNGLDTTRNYPNIFQYCLILPDIAPISPEIARYWVISLHIAQNMSPFNVTITVMVQKKYGLSLNFYGPVTDRVKNPVTMLSRSSHGAYRPPLLHSIISTYLFIFICLPCFILTWKDIYKQQALSNI